MNYAFLNSQIRQGLYLSIFALACGGNVASGEPADAGNDVSQAGSGGGTVATSTAVTSGSGMSVSTATGSAGSSTGTGGAGGAGGGADWGACGGPGECTVQYNGCCEACVVANIGEFMGVNAKSVQQFRQQICPIQPPCDACIPAPRPFFGARCTNGRCEVFDVRQVPEFSKCGVDGDCRLRKGLDCCECGAPGEWTAVSNSGEAPLSKVVCAPMTGCLECAPTPPPGLKAVCTMNHCDLAAIK